MPVDDALILNPGTLRHQVMIQQPVITKTASGADVVSSWPTFVSAKASFDDPKARKFFAADAPVVEKLYPVAMHWQAGIKETMQLLFDGRTFEIMTAVDVQERHRVLFLNVRELL